MERQPLGVKDVEQPEDAWRKFILAERQLGVHQSLVQAASLVSGREEALVLGDASKIQSRYLLDEAAFAKVTDVDSSPSLLDDEVIRQDDIRLDRVLQPFDSYMPPSNTFDLVYGKSISFNPKATTPLLLSRICDSLKDSESIFSAEWALHGDTFRSQTYTEDELHKLYADAQLQILEGTPIGPKHSPGLSNNPGISNTIIINAKRS